MNAVEVPQVYVVLGLTGSGRRSVVADLLQAGLSPDEARAASVLVAENEPAHPLDETLPLQRWRLVDDLIVADLPPGSRHVFFLADGTGNPVDQLEALKPWMASSGAALARVLCVVHCQLAEANPPLLVWYDACIHFSDVVLLNRREGVANKWMSDFRHRYEDQFFPCLFELVKDGRVKNPALVLEPEPRRISHAFDEEVDWVVETAGEDDGGEGDEEVTAAPAVDPYFERRAGGRRAKELPDVTRYLNVAESPDDKP